MGKLLLEWGQNNCQDVFGSYGIFSIFFASHEYLAYYKWTENLEPWEQLWTVDIFNYCCFLTVISKLEMFPSWMGELGQSMGWRLCQESQMVLLCECFATLSSPVVLEKEPRASHIWASIPLLATFLVLSSSFAFRKLVNETILFCYFTCKGSEITVPF